jgi:hypothetical protein
MPTKHLHVAFAAADVHLLPPIIDEDIIGITARREFRDQRSTSTIKDGDLCRTTVRDPQPSISFVERHCKISSGVRETPVRNDLARCAIDDGNLRGVRDVDEYPRPGRLHLKRFRMTWQRDVAGQFERGAVQDREPACSVADDHFVPVAADAHVVCVRPEIDRRARRKVGTGEPTH